MLLNSLVTRNIAFVEFCMHAATSKMTFGIKGVLNPNFQPFSFELKKKKIFWNKFWSRFQSSVTSNTEDIWNSFSP